MTNPTWFITGASSGFGKAFTLYALEQGYRVVASARSLERLRTIFPKPSEKLLLVELDVTRANSAELAVKTAMLRFGNIDVFINNAGIAIVGAFEETPEAELRRIMETNFFGAAAMIRAVLPGMRERGSGTIVNISSMGGQMSFAGVGAYSATKFALEGLSEALAQELAPFGIKIMIVEPGAFRTNLVANAEGFMPPMEAYRENMASMRQAMQLMNGSQPGDPFKAAAAIDRAIKAPNMPLRLQLGEDSINAIREHARTLLDELGCWEKLGKDTRLD